MDNGDLTTIIAKKCPSCGILFSLSDIINQPFIEPKGITLYDKNPDMNMFFFNHVCPTCNTTFAIPAKDFIGFLKEDIPNKVLAGLPECETRCMDINDKDVCRQNCQWAPFRRFILQLIENKKKANNIVSK